MITTTTPRCATVPLKESQKGSANPGCDRGQCPDSPDGYAYGWHFKLSDESASFVSIKCTFEKAGVITSMVKHPDDKHIYVFTPKSDKLIDASAEIIGQAKHLILKHVCHPDH